MLTVAIYFRVPYYGIAKHNLWNVMLIKEEKVNKAIYKRLYERSLTADGSWWENRKLENPESTVDNIQLAFSGSMSPSSKSTAEVCIEEIED